MKICRTPSFFTILINNVTLDGVHNTLLHCFKMVVFGFSSTLGFCGEAHFMIHPVALFRGSCVLCARDGKILNWRDKNRQNSKQLTTEVSEDQRLILRFILYKLTFFSHLSSTDSYILNLCLCPESHLKWEEFLNKKNLSKLIVSTMYYIIYQKCNFTE